CRGRLPGTQRFARGGALRDSASGPHLARQMAARGLAHEIPLPRQEARLAERTRSQFPDTPRRLIARTGMEVLCRYRFVEAFVRRREEMNRFCIQLVAL